MSVPPAGTLSKNFNRSRPRPRLLVKNAGPSRVASSVAVRALFSKVPAFTSRTIKRTGARRPRQNRSRLRRQKPTPARNRQHRLQHLRRLLPLPPAPPLHPFPVPVPPHRHLPRLPPPRNKSRGFRRASRKMMFFEINLTPSISISDFFGSAKSHRLRAFEKSFP